MLNLFIILVLSAPAHALDVFSLNVFDQLQGDWPANFREKRMELMAGFVNKSKPAIVVFQEARGILPGSEKGGSDSVDGEKIKKLYPHRKYLHEMIGKDGASYGYWIGAKNKPQHWIEDGFSFPGGVERKVIGAVWKKAIGKECLGVLGLHLSYQNSEVRQKEAAWLIDWLKNHEKDCKQWLVVGDFNAAGKDKEMQLLFEAGLKSLYKEEKPTVGPFNSIRAIYGKDKPNLTIDWALGWNLSGSAELVLHEADKEGNWVSDHAGVLVKLR